MIVYRIQGSTGDEWVIEWVAHLKEAREIKALMQEAYDRVWLDKIEISGGRTELVAALNHAHDNRSVWKILEDLQA